MKKSNNQKYIVYHGLNMVNRLKAIVRHLVENPDKKCILIGQFDDSYKVFKNVEHVINYFDFNGLQIKESGKDYQTFTLDFFDNAFKEIGITLDQIEEHYVGSYHGNYAHYLQMKSIKHYFVEEAAGILKYSENSFIIKKYVTLSEIEEDKKNEKCLVNYDICEELLNLKPDEKKQILDFFNVPKIDFSQYDTILLTQWKRDNDWETCVYDDVIYMYSLVLDYYIPNDKVYIKCHPIDPLGNKYAEYFNDCYVDCNKYPSELVRIIPGLKLKKAITLYSTSINTFNDISDELVRIGSEYLDVYEQIIRYDLSIELSKFLNEFNLNVIRYGIYYRDISSMPGFFDDIPFGNCCDNDSIVITDEFYYTEKIRKAEYYDKVELGDDEIQMKKIESDLKFASSKAIGTPLKFINALKNTNNVFIITNYFEEIFHKCALDFNHIVIIKISKDKVKHICAADLQNEYVYVYCKDIKIRNKIQEFSFFKHLYQTGIIVKSKILNLEETQLHFENLKLQSKQIQLNNKVKTLEQGIVQTQKQNETLKNELIKVIQKSNALEKFAVDSKNIIEMYKQEFIKVNKRLNELEK